MSHKSPVETRAFLHGLLKLLSLELKLSQQNRSEQSFAHGYMTLSLREHCSDAIADQLKSVQGLLEEYTTHHAELLSLLRQRLELWANVRRQPKGNGGHYHQILSRKELDANKSSISQLLAV